MTSRLLVRGMAWIFVGAASDSGTPTDAGRHSPARRRGRRPAGDSSGRGWVDTGGVALPCVEVVVPAPMPSNSASAFATSSASARSSWMRLVDGLARRHVDLLREVDVGADGVGVLGDDQRAGVGDGDDFSVGMGGHDLRRRPAPPRPISNTGAAAQS